MRGQVSMEYLMITAMAFLLLAPIIIIAYSESNDFHIDVSQAQIEKVGSEIVAAANAVSYTGPPAKRTIKLYFPDGIKATQITGREVVFTMTGHAGPYEYSAVAEANLSGSLNTFAGTHTITIVAGTTNVTITDG